MLLWAIALTVLLGFCNSCSAQYSAQIAGYNVYIYDVHEVVPTQYLMDVGENDFHLQWERGGQNPFDIPATWTEYYVHWIPNAEGLWDGATAMTTDSVVVSFVQGYYAVTLTEVDINNAESSKAIPFYLYSREVYARIPLNVLINQQE